MSENTIKTREELKSTFITGAVPTQQDFHDLLDAYVHKDDEQSESTANINPLESIDKLIRAYVRISHTNDYSGYNITEYKPIANVPLCIPSYYGGSFAINDVNTNNGRYLYASRTIIYHNGKFYDNGKPEKKLNAYFQFIAGDGSYFNVDCADSQSGGGSSSYHITSDTSTESDQWDTYIDYNTSSSATFTVNSSSVNVVVNYNATTHMCSVHIYDSETQEQTYNSAHIYLYNDLGDEEPFTIFKDENMTIEDNGPLVSFAHQEGYALDLTNIPSNYDIRNVYVKLVDEINPLSGIGYFTALCFYSETPDSELTQGTYYRLNEGEEYFEEYIIEPETTEE